MYNEWTLIDNPFIKNVDKDSNKQFKREEITLPIINKYENKDKNDKLQLSIKKDKNDKNDKNDKLQLSIKKDKNNNLKSIYIKSNNYIKLTKPIIQIKPFNPIKLNIQRNPINHNNYSSFNKQINTINYTHSNKLNKPSLQKDIDPYTFNNKLINRKSKIITKQPYKYDNNLNINSNNVCKKCGCYFISKNNKYSICEECNKVSLFDICKMFIPI